jgi:uncharacterized membrane protein (DUF2068 family)
MTHPPTAPRSKDRDIFLFLIALLKLFKAFLLIIVAIGALRLLHKDVAVNVHDWIVAIRFDPENRWIHRALLKLGVVNDHYLKAISAGSFFYAALLSLEGIGLLLRKRWAEYFTIIMTGSLIPLEIYEIARRVTLVKIILIILNVAIVAYLVARLRRERRNETLPDPTRTVA